MMLLAKAALGLGSTLVLAGVYTFHEGVIRVDVDEYRAGGSHVHLWVPAAAVPLALHVAPRCRVQKMAGHMREYLPTMHVIMKELRKYPNADFVEVKDGEEHVQIRMHEGKLQIDVDAPEQKVHLLFPLSTLDEITSQLETNAPGA